MASAKSRALRLAMRSATQAPRWGHRCFCAWNTDAPSWRSMTILGLDGSTATLETALLKMREINPQQVMVETDAQRLQLAQRQKPVQGSNESSSSSTAGASSDSSSSGEVKDPLSHIDAIAEVHGGLRARDLRAIVLAAESINAQVYTIDRAYQNTQNQVAKHLLMRPRELASFVRHSAIRLSGKDASEEPLSEELRKMLEDDRESHMVSEVMGRAVADADVFVVCRQERVSALSSMLIPGSDGIVVPNAGPTESQATRVWPLLLVLVYVILPGYGSIWLAYKASRILVSFMPGPREIMIAPAAESSTAAGTSSQEASFSEDSKSETPATPTATTSESQRA
mmetsp:Transcript_58190/g.123559  ORF Transcript_58190/g.123559 Transcript_58190/m.123559 type:complete len:341 (-) Transcript_58190:288-1310(-)|eukprot:CAMPEP_0206462772 /NCGR_PEP_ID=MMETSP0324_2-20121206/26184_1 /ASSEMBLY_ACC=CAM_ASM_000836 /TAXON_ID=2866 /ORGANISM="Crypthecodinium cohnii, Strain Seligo" /LENGTH=340 /DNA_ID=CAMNT_0053935005 /DNA_START=32 /DNA_END=1057 /DNA_ORIENTATION=+